MKSWKIACMLLLVPMATACGEDEEMTAGANNSNVTTDELEAEGCEHHQEGPFATIQAQTLATGTLENMSIEHTSVIIKLGDVEGGKGGYVSLIQEEEAEARIMLTQSVPVTIMDINGAMVPLEMEIEGAQACDEIAVQYFFDLEVGTYTVFFGPTTVTEVASVIESGEHDHEDENNHDHEDENNHDHEDENNHDHEDENNHNHEGE